MKYLTHPEFGSAKEKTSQIYETLLKIFAVAKQERVPTHEASNRLAERRITQAAGEKQPKSV